MSWVSTERGPQGTVRSSHSNLKGSFPESGAPMSRARRRACPRTPAAGARAAPACTPGTGTPAAGRWRICSTHLRDLETRPRAACATAAPKTRSCPSRPQDRRPSRAGFPLLLRPLRGCRFPSRALTPAGRPPEPHLGSRSPGLTAASHVDLPPRGVRHTVLCPLWTRPSPPQRGPRGGSDGAEAGPEALHTRGTIPCEPTGGPARSLLPQGPCRG